MKKNLTVIACLLVVSFFSSCKKDYACKATAFDVDYVFNCENCTKKKVDEYKAEIESKGYSDVSCDKK